MNNIFRNYLTIEEFKNERPSMAAYSPADIQEGINISADLLDAKCNFLISEVLRFNLIDRDLKDMNDPLFRNERELDCIKKALIIQTQYSINLANDYTAQSNSFSSGGLNTSYSRPQNFQEIAPGVFEMLSRARVYQVSGMMIGEQKQIANEDKTACITKSSKEQIEEGSERIFLKKKQDASLKGNVATLDTYGNIQFTNPKDLTGNAYDADKIKDRDGVYRTIGDVKGLAGYGTNATSAITRGETQELIGNSVGGRRGVSYPNEMIVKTYNDIDNQIQTGKSNFDNNINHNPLSDENRNEFGGKLIPAQAEVVDYETITDNVLNSPQMTNKLLGIKNELDNQFYGLEKELTQEMEALEKEVEDNGTIQEKKVDDKLADIDKKIAEQDLQIDTRLTAMENSIEPTIIEKVNLELNKRPFDFPNGAEKNEIIEFGSKSEFDAFVSEYNTLNQNWGLSIQPSDFSVATPLLDGNSIQRNRSFKFLASTQDSTSPTGLRDQSFTMEKNNIELLQKQFDDNDVPTGSSASLQIKDFKVIAKAGSRTLEVSSNGVLVNNQEIVVKPLFDSEIDALKQADNHHNAELGRIEGLANAINNRLNTNIDPRITTLESKQVQTTEQYSHEIKINPNQIQRQHSYNNINNSQTHGYLYLIALNDQKILSALSDKKVASMEVFIKTVAPGEPGVTEICVTNITSVSISGLNVYIRASSLVVGTPHDQGDFFRDAMYVRAVILN